MFNTRLFVILVASIGAVSNNPVNKLTPKQKAELQEIIVDFLDLKFIGQDKQTVTKTKAMNTMIDAYDKAIKALKEKTKHDMSKEEIIEMDKEVLLQAKVGGVSDKLEIKIMKKVYNLLALTLYTRDVSKGDLTNEEVFKTLFGVFDNEIQEYIETTKKKYH